VGVPVAAAEGEPPGFFEAAGVAEPAGFTSTSAAKRAPEASTTAATGIQNLRMTAYATRCSRFRKINSRPTRKERPVRAVALTVAIPVLCNTWSVVGPGKMEATYPLFAPQEHPAFWSALFARTTRRVAAKPEVTGSEAAAEKRCILVVDDHKDTLFSMKVLLKRLGFEVLTAKNMDEALDIAEKRHFDILLSDIGLPDGSGLELLRKIRARRDVPALALSGFGMDEDIERSRGAGFADHLVKPVSLDRLRRAIANL
jgi:CheY-like chemotaxis protein